MEDQDKRVLHNKKNSDSGVKQGEIAKRIFSPNSKLKTQNLLEKVLKTNKSGSASDGTLSPNDSLDFKDAPKLRKTKAKLKLKSCSSLEKKNGSASEDSDAAIKIFDKKYGTTQPSSEAFTSVRSKDTGIVVSKISVSSERNEESDSNFCRAENVETRNQSEEGQASGKENMLSDATSSTCRICGNHIPSSQFEEHRRSCLQEMFSNKPGNGMSGSNTCPVEKKCDICNKIISSMNSRAQSQHINNCLDKLEKEKQQQNEHIEMLLQARDAVLGCPLCRKNFKSQQSRQGHLKKCAKDNGMTVDRLKLLMKQQEEDYAAKLEAGILPEEFKGKRKGDQIAVKAKRTAFSKMSLDEDTQLAMALSSSLMSGDSRQSEDFQELVNKIGTVKTEEQVEGPSVVQTLLQGEGGKATARGKKGKQAESTCALLTLSREEAAQRISNRVDRYIFNPIQVDTGAKTPTFKRSKLAGCETLPSSPNSVAQAQDCLLESQASKNFLWLKSSSNGKSQGIQSPTSFPGTEEESCNEVIEEDRSASGLKDNRLEYYTTELMPPVSVSCVRTGSKMKRVSAIPGRRKSAGPSGQVYCEFPASSISPADSESLHTSEVPPSQTVQDLAQLAFESDITTMAATDGEQQDSKDLSDHKPTDFGLDAADWSHASSSFSSYGCMVNNSLYSDLSIVAAENSCDGGNNSNQTKAIKAHKIILHVQCPKLLAICEGNRIDLSGYSEQAVLSLLKFLYCDGRDAWWMPEYEEQVLQLAERFSIDRLSQAVQTLSTSTLTVKRETDDGSAPDATLSTSTLTVKRETGDGSAPDATLSTSTLTVKRETDDGSAPDATLSTSILTVKGETDDGSAPDATLSTSTLTVKGETDDGSAPDATLSMSTLTVKGETDDGSAPDANSVKPDLDGVDEMDCSPQDGRNCNRETQSSIYHMGESTNEQEYVNTELEVKEENFSHSQVEKIENLGAALAEELSLCALAEERDSANAEMFDEKKDFVNMTALVEENNPVNFAAASTEDDKSTSLKSHDNATVSDTSKTGVAPIMATNEIRTPKQNKERVSMKAFKEAVQSLSKGDAEVEDEMINRIVVKVEKNLPRPGSPVFYPSILNNDDVSPDELSITSAIIVSPVEKNRRKRVTNKDHGACERKKVQATIPVKPNPSASLGQFSGTGLSPPKTTDVYEYDSGEDLFDDDDSLSLCEKNSTDQRYTPRPLTGSSERVASASAPFYTPTSKSILKEKTGASGKFQNLSALDGINSPFLQTNNSSPLRSINLSSAQHVVGINPGCNTLSQDALHQQLQGAPTESSHQLETVADFVCRSQHKLSNATKGEVESKTSLMSPPQQPENIEVIKNSKSSAKTTKDNAEGISTVIKNLSPHKFHCQAQFESFSHEFASQIDSACIHSSPPSSQAGTRRTKRGFATKSSPLFKLRNKIDLCGEADEEIKTKIENPIATDLCGSSSNSMGQKSPQLFTKVKEKKETSLHPHNISSKTETLLNCRKSLDFNTSHGPVHMIRTSREAPVPTSTANADRSTDQISNLNPNAEAVISNEVGSLLQKESLENSPLPLRERLKMKLPFGHSAALVSDCTFHETKDSTHLSHEKPLISDHTEILKEGFETSQTEEVELLETGLVQGDSGSYSKTVEDQDGSTQSKKSEALGEKLTVIENSDAIDEIDGTGADEDDLDLLGEVERCEQELAQEATPPTTSYNVFIMRQMKEPSPFTPMAPYDSMATPLLKKAVEKIGVRPMGKKRMREVLKKVYDQTHQYETDSDYEPTPLKRPKAEFVPDKAITAQSRGTQDSPRQVKDCERDLLKTQMRSQSYSTGSSGSLARGQGVKDGVTKDGEINADDLPQPQDSSSSDGPDLAEESILQGWPEEETAASQMTQTSEEQTTERLAEFMRSNNDIYEDILMYRPLELDVLKKRILSAGIRVSMPKVMDFLDERCITFTMKNMSSRKGRSQKGPTKKDKHKASKQNPSNC